MNTTDLILTGESWTSADMCPLLTGIDAVGSALSGITGDDADAAYKAVFGGVRFELSWSLRNRFTGKPLNGHAQYGKVSFRPRKLTPFLVAHELGHIFSMLYPETLKLLWKGIYLPDGELLTGAIAGVYSRHAGRHAPDNGFQSDDWKAGYKLSSINNESEDFADTFRGFVFNDFADNIAGATLYAWIYNCIKVWLQV